MILNKKFARLLREDTAWSDFVVVSRNSYLPEFDKYIEEMRGLHKHRSVRILALSQPTGRRLAEAALKDQAVRSRCVEIVVDVQVAAAMLRLAMQNITNHLLAEYNDDLKGFGLTRVADQRAFMSSFLAGSSSRLQKLQDIVDTADLIIKDIDQAGFSLKHAVSALEVAVRRETV